MRHIVVENKTIGSAYKEILKYFDLEYPIKYQEVSALIIVENPELIDLSCPSTKKYEKYLDEILNLNLKKRWIINDDWYLSYSRRLFSTDNIKKINGLVEELKNNLYSRRIVLFTERNTDLYGCCPALNSLQIYIDEEKYVNFFTSWRSKEARFALPINTIEIISLCKYMLEYLQKEFKELKCGKYVEYIVCLHINEDFSKTEGKLDSNFGEGIENIDDSVIKFYWSIIERNREGEYDENYYK